MSILDVMVQRPVPAAGRPGSFLKPPADDGRADPSADGNGSRKAGFDVLLAGQSTRSGQGADPSGEAGIVAGEEAGANPAAEDFQTEITFEQTPAFNETPALDEARALDEEWRALLTVSYGLKQGEDAAPASDAETTADVVAADAPKKQMAIAPSAASPQLVLAADPAGGQQDGEPVAPVEDSSGPKLSDEPEMKTTTESALPGQSARQEPAPAVKSTVAHAANPEGTVPDVPETAVSTTNEDGPSAPNRPQPVEGRDRAEPRGGRQAPGIQVALAAAAQTGAVAGRLKTQAGETATQSPQPGVVGPQLAAPAETGTPASISSAVANATPTADMQGAAVVVEGGKSAAPTVERPSGAMKGKARLDEVLAGRTLDKAASETQGGMGRPAVVAEELPVKRFGTHEQNAKADMAAAASVETGGTANAQPAGQGIGLGETARSIVRGLTDNAHGLSQAPAAATATHATTALSLLTPGQTMRELRIALNPASFGHVNATLKLEGSRLTVNVDVENGDAYRHLATSGDDIIKALQADGYTVDDIVIRQIAPGERNGQGQMISQAQDQSALQSGGQGQSGNGSAGAREFGSERQGRQGQPGGFDGKGSEAVHGRESDASRSDRSDGVYL